MLSVVYVHGRKLQVLSLARDFLARLSVLSNGQELCGQIVPRLIVGIACRYYEPAGIGQYCTTYAYDRQLIFIKVGSIMITDTQKVFFIADLAADSAFCVPGWECFDGIVRPYLA